LTTAPAAGYEFRGDRIRGIRRIKERDVVVVRIILSAIIVVRTILEDRTLRSELPGYAEYAASVRRKLVPFVW
jgi:hypothetical protein